MTRKKSQPSKKTSGTRLTKLIGVVERMGNYLPHPFTLFVILIGVMFVLSYFLSRAGVSVTYTSLDSSVSEPVTQTVTVSSLLDKVMLQQMMQNFVKTFAYFAPVGFVMVMVLGVSVAEQTGLFSAVIRQTVLRTPAYLITFMIAVVGICANLASDAGIIIAPTLGGAIFLAMKRHPVAGVCVGYVAAYGGFSANLFVSGTDVILAGITQSATSHFGIDAPVHPLMNWYTMMASTVVLAVVVTIVTEKIIIPYLGSYDPAPDTIPASMTEFRLGKRERRGLWVAGLLTLVFILILLVLTLPSDGLLRNTEGKLLPRSPLISGIIFILFVYFVVVGVAYGLVAGTIRSEKDIPRMMEKGLLGIAGFLVVCLPASVFIDLFNKSQMTTVIAVNGANLIRELHIGMIPTLLIFALLCAFLNIFITSGFTKWLILAPIFIPMFFQLGLSPAITQMSYRIGDSTTNIVSPVSAYLPFLLGLLEKYKAKGQQIGIGSAISLMLPYSAALIVLWILFLGLWLLLGLNPGPGVSIFL